MKIKTSITFACFTFLLSIASFAQTQKSKVKVAFLLYPEVAILDYTGPLDAFVKANRMTGNQYEVFTVSESTAPIQTQGHVLAIQADYIFSEAPHADILIIPGAKIDIVERLATNEKYASFIQAYSKETPVTMSVCTGSFILGRLGLLDGLSATTHWIYGEKFSKQFTNTKLVENIRYVDEGKIITTSGVTTGIDGAIHLVRRYSGDNLAEQIERGLQHMIDLNEPWPKRAR